MGEKSKTFAIRIVELCRYCRAEKKEYILSEQILRSGTSIGANIAEADYAFSHKDFVSKLSISLKETAETIYWLDLLYETDYLSREWYSSLHRDAKELVRLLAAAVKTAKARN